MWRWFTWSLRFLVTGVVRVLRIFFGLLGKLFAVLLSPFVWATQKGYNVLDRHYPALLDWALTRRAAVLLTAFGLLAATALILPRLGTELIPQLSQGEFTVKMRLPAGSPLETTDAQVQVIHGAAKNLPALESAYAVAGTGNRLDANPVDSGENTGNLDVKLRAPIDKEGEELAIQELRTRLASIPGVQYEFTRPSLLTLATPVEVIQPRSHLAQPLHDPLDVEPLVGPVERLADGRVEVGAGQGVAQLCSLGPITHLPMRRSRRARCGSARRRSSRPGRCDCAVRLSTACR